MLKISAQELIHMNEQKLPPHKDIIMIYILSDKSLRVERAIIARSISDRADETDSLV